MGDWLELLLIDVKSIEESIVPIVATLSCLISKFRSFFDNYRENVFMPTCG